MTNKHKQIFTKTNSRTVLPKRLSNVKKKRLTVRTTIYD